MEEEIPPFSPQDDFKFMSDITIDGEFYLRIFEPFEQIIFL